MAVKPHFAPNHEVDVPRKAKLSQAIAHGGQRCHWCGEDPLYVAYHDLTWGRPVQRPRELFMKLCLDGQQAGLSWITILKKEQNFFEAFAHFDPHQILKMTARELSQLKNNPGIIRSQLKIESIVRNSRAYVGFLERGEHFGEFMWSFVDGRPSPRTQRPPTKIPTQTKESEAMSKALKHHGFNFVGPTICYAFMQAVGMVNDHLVSCPSYGPCDELAMGFRFSKLPDAPAQLGQHVIAAQNLATLKP